MKANIIIENVKKSLVGSVVAILSMHRDDESNFALSSTPVIREDLYDYNNSYTLDRVRLAGDGFCVDASSCCDSVTIHSDDLKVEEISGILDFILVNKDEIWESDKEAIIASIKEYILKRYENSSVCLYDLLWQISIDELSALGVGSLSVEDMMEIYCSLMNEVEKDEFYRENTEDNFRKNILTDEEHPLSGEFKAKTFCGHDLSRAVDDGDLEEARQLYEGGEGRYCERTFNTEAERDAYRLGMNDMDGWENVLPVDDMVIPDWAVHNND